LIVSIDSLIRWSSWLLGHEGNDFGAFQKNLAADPENPEPPFLDESGDGLPRNAADACCFRL
jgi:hypothetical protein